MRAETARGARGLQFGHRKGLDALEGDGAVIALDLPHAVADLVAQHGVCAKGVQVHVAADADQLRSAQVIEREVVLEDLADFDDVRRGGSLAGGADFAEEVGEFLALGVRRGYGEACFLHCCAEEFGDFFAGCAEGGRFGVFGLLGFVGAGEEVGEEFQGDGEEELGEGDNDEDGEWDEAAKVLNCAVELGRCQQMKNLERELTRTCRCSLLVNS